jgi:hypothetical protein
MNARDAPPPPVPPRQPAPPTPATVGPPPFLAEEHRAHLRTSGLSDETIAACRFETIVGDAVSETYLARILGWKSKPPKDAPLGRGILIPYLQPDGSPTTCFAFRPDRPRPMPGKDKPAKYLRTSRGEGEGSPPYLPANGHALIASPLAPIVIVEGEKKAAAIAQVGIGTIGIGGVWNAHVKRECEAAGRYKLNEEIGVHTRFKDVVICFDADAYTNDMVMDAARVLAGMLREAGASSVAFCTPGDLR